MKNNGVASGGAQGIARAIVHGVAHRAIFLVLAGASLITGMAAGASLLGFNWGPAGAAASLADDHGPLMVFGFVGGAIGIERAVAARRVWSWIGPVLHAVGTVAVIAGAPRGIAAAAFAGSFAMLGVIYAHIYSRQATLAVVVQAVGVIGGVAAAIQWATTGSFVAAMPLAVLYAVATIVGERMELARVTLAGARAEGRLAALVLLLAGAAVFYILAPGVGYRVMGAVLIVIAGYSARHDVARNLVRSTGLPRYSAACMLAGYAWLALGGAFWLGYGQGVTGHFYDASVHAIFLGFVISMIFAHAPIILTSVIRRRLPYHPVLYLPVVLLHFGLFVRVASDLRAAQGGFQAGGLINISAILVFLVCGITLSLKEGRRADRNKR